MPFYLNKSGIHGPCVEEDELGQQPEKNKAIKEMEHPFTKHQVQQFLGTWGGITDLLNMHQHFNYTAK